MRLGIVLRVLLKASYKNMQGWKEATIIKAVESGDHTSQASSLARLLYVCVQSKKVGVVKQVCILCLTNQNMLPPPLV